MWIHRHVCDMCHNYNHYSNTNLHIKRMYWQRQRQHVQSEGADDDWGTMTVAQVTPHPPVSLPLMVTCRCMIMCACAHTVQNTS